MFLYKIYNFDYDDTAYIVLQHKTKFTKEEYETIINDCRKKVKDKIKRNNEIIDSGIEITKEMAEELELFTCTGDWDVLSNIKKILIKEYGFEEIDILFTYVLNGGSFIDGTVAKNKVIDN